MVLSVLCNHSQHIQNIGKLSYNIYQGNLSYTVYCQYHTVWPIAPPPDLYNISWKSYFGSDCPFNCSPTNLLGSFSWTLNVSAYLSQSSWDSWFSCQSRPEACMSPRTSAGKPWHCCYWHPGQEVTGAGSPPVWPGWTACRGHKRTRSGWIYTGQWRCWWRLCQYQLSFSSLCGEMQRASHLSLEGEQLHQSPPSSSACPSCPSEAGDKTRREEYRYYDLIVQCVSGWRKPKVCFKQRFLMHLWKIVQQHTVQSYKIYNTDLLQPMQHTSSNKFCW